jgi:ribonuclease HII
MLQPYLLPNCLEAGVDEVGRGCLAGIVVAAAVILPPPYRLQGLEGLDDSKKLKEEERLRLFKAILKIATQWQVGYASVSEIEEYNILRATMMAMHRALDNMTVRPKHILVDGNRFTPYRDIPHTTVVKGDGIYMSIAAASVVAKVCRDRIMAEESRKYPAYHFDRNKGYPTKEHREAIRQYGLCDIHRRSFKLL